MSKKHKETIIVRGLIRYEGKYLLIQRGSGAKREGEWEIPGGKLDPGETLEQAIHREILEETGLDLSGFKFHKSSSYVYEDDDRLGVVFEVDSPTDEVKLSFEHQDFKWVNSSELNNIELPKVYQELFKKLAVSDENENTTVKLDENMTTKTEHIIVYTDGGSRGNPGPSASGFVIMDEQERVLEEGGEYLGITTNNQAEYQAVKLALETARKYGKIKVDFYIDSLLVVNQMNGSYKIKNKDLWPIHQRINELSKSFKEVSFTHVRREFNSLADAKVNEVLDSYNHRDTPEEST